MGLIVQKNWQQIPDHFNHVELDAFIIMPNHFHAIIKLKAENHIAYGKKKEIAIKSQKQFYSAISPKSGSISTIVRSFKSSCSREINLMNPELHFKWQPRFYDVIIRNMAAHIRIRNYIINNPRNWKEDLFSPK